MSQALSLHLVRYMKREYRRQVDEVFRTATGSDLRSDWDALTQNQRELFAKTVTGCLRKKFATYNNTQDSSDPLLIRDSLRKDVKRIFCGYDGCTPVERALVNQDRQILSTCINDHTISVLSRAARMAMLEQIISWTTVNFSEAAPEPSEVPPELATPTTDESPVLSQSWQQSVQGELAQFSELESGEIPPTPPQLSLSECNERGKSSW